jgi:pSer/pThr/pTyr-binding forkhead associated (FHA) protein
MELELGGRRYPVAAGDFFIGNGPGAALTVEGAGVRPTHALVTRQASGMLVVAPGEPGAEILVNGVRLGSDPIPLTHGDKLGIAGHEITVLDPGRAGAMRDLATPPFISPAAQPVPAETAQPPAGADYRLGNTVVGLQAIRRTPPMPAPAPEASGGPLAVLLIRKGKRKGERIPVKTPVVNIGRGEYNDVVLPDASISADHAKLQLKEGIWVLTDLGSTNGSRVDGQPVRGDIGLSPGAELVLGEVVLLFEPRDQGILSVPRTTSLPELKTGSGGLPTSAVLGGLLLLAALVAFLVLG